MAYPNQGRSIFNSQAPSAMEEQGFDVEQKYGETPYKSKSVSIFNSPKAPAPREYAGFDVEAQVPPVDKMNDGQAFGGAWVQDGKLSETEGAIAGAGVQAVSTIAQGALEAGQNKRLREKAEANAMQDLAYLKKQRDEENARLDIFTKYNLSQKKIEELGKVAALRSTMLANDLANEVQAYKDRQDLVDNINKHSATNASFKDAMISRIGGYNVNNG